MTADNRVVLVTGANKGIGYEAVKLLSQKIPNGKILLGSRSVQNGEDAIKKMKDSESSHDFSNVVVVKLDIVSEASLKAVVEQIRSDYGKLDVLVHNSGVSHSGGDSISKGIFDVNLQGARATLLAFLPLLPQNATVVVVSSEVGLWNMHALNDQLQRRLDDPKNITWSKIDKLSSDWLAFAHKESHEEDWPELSAFTGGYTTSKTLLSAWLRAFALEHPEIQLAITTPGYCATELNNWSGPRAASVGGESIVWPLFNKFETGKFYWDGENHGFIEPLPEEFKHK